MKYSFEGLKEVLREEVPIL